MTESGEQPEAPQPPPRKSGIARLIAATGYSFAGLRAAYKSEEAIRLEFWLFLVLAPLGYWLGITASEKVLLVGSLVMVLVAELLNTAIEAVVDRFGGEYHELARIAKDTGSAAVFLCMMLVLFTWGVLLF